MKTPIQNLRDMIQRMTENGGDYDLLCVLGLIDDRFINDEKEEFLKAVTYGQNNYSVSISHDKQIAERYYIENFKK